MIGAKVNFKASIFTIVSVISCVSLCPNNAYSDTCDGKGWYVYDASPDWCMPCPAGCYCPNNAEKMKYSKVDWQPCTSGLDALGIYKCPSGYTSDSTTEKCTGLGKHTYCRGPQSEQECYFKAKDTGKRIYFGQTSINCKPGTYAKAGYGECQPCPSGKICPGKRAIQKEAKKGLSIGLSLDVAANTTWDSSWKLETSLFRSPLKDSGVYSCPSGQTADASHTSCTSAKKVKCEAGRYLPSGWTSCTSCKSDGNRYYCPGGSFSAAPSTNMGLKECPSGKVANSDKTGCIVPPTHCDPGQYLPRGATQCKDCKSRYYLCAGGPITVGLTYDQGIRKCDGNLVANAENTSCVTDTVAKENLELIKSLPAGTISVPAGKYLPAGKRTPATCRGTTNYCPGGDFDEASVDQGIVECPKNTRANKDKTACTATFTKIQMQYGPYGKDTPYTRQCWLKTDSADFKSCVFGTK